MTSWCLADPCESRTDLQKHWQIAVEAPGVRLYAPTDLAAEYPAVVARLRWDGAAPRLYRLVRQYEHFAAFVPRVRQSRIMRRDGSEIWVYQQLHFPGPLRDRHYILRSTDTESSRAAGERYRIDWRLDHQFGVPARAGLVEAKVLRGCWDIRQAGAAAIDAVYRVEFDPGGLLPRPILQAALQRYVMTLLEALQDRLATP